MRRGVVAVAAVQFGATLATACIDRTITTPGPAARDLVVQAVLDAGSRDQYVVVQTTDGSISSQVAVSGATVTMTLPNGASVVAVEEGDSGIAATIAQQPPISRVYHFSLDRLGVSLVPGGTYRLRVAVPDGRVATGHTTIPAASAVLAAPDTVSFDRARDTLTVLIARVPGAAGYELDVGRALGQSLVFRTFSDTAVSLPGTTDAFGGGVSSAPVDVVVSALDSAYYAYYRRSGDPLSGVGAVGNLTGALGVFGSIVEVRRITLLVR